MRSRAVKALGIFGLQALWHLSAPFTEDKHIGRSAFPRAKTLLNKKCWQLEVCSFNLTPYAMHGFELIEKLSGWPDPSRLHILQALTDSFCRIGMCGDIAQTLTDGSVLPDAC